MWITCCILPSWRLIECLCVHICMWMFVWVLYVWVRPHAPTKNPDNTQKLFSFPHTHKLKLISPWRSLSHCYISVNIQGNFQFHWYWYGRFKTQDSEFKVHIRGKFLSLITDTLCSKRKKKVQNHAQEKKTTHQHKYKTSLLRPSRYKMKQWLKRSTPQRKVGNGKGVGDDYDTLQRKRTKYIL